MDVLRDVPLSEWTTFRIGGRAALLARVQTPEELSDAFALARQEDVEAKVLGGGSNVLVSDAGFPGLVVRNEISGIRFTREAGGAVLVSAGAGEAWDTLVSESVERGLFGLENLSAIPGSVGAAPVQNIGAYGAELADVLESVSVWDSKTNSFETLSKKECALGYRDSLFKHGEGRNLIVTGITLTLSERGVSNLSYRDLQERFGDSNPTLGEVREAVQNIRAKKFPNLSEKGTAGSFFKNPIVSVSKAVALAERFPKMPQFPASRGVKLSLAWILDHVCDAKSLSVGDASVFPAQALVIVNNHRASSADVQTLARELESRVLDRIGVSIEREVRDF